MLNNVGSEGVHTSITLVLRGSTCNVQYEQLSALANLLQQPIICTRQSLND